jgi:hypothetical protein
MGRAMTLLRDLGSEEFETAVGDLPVAAGDSWLVLLDRDGRPVSAIEPGAELDVSTPPPPIIVAPAGLGLNTALTSAAFTQARDVNAVVLVEEQGVVGVWGGRSLATVLTQGPRATRGGSELPGVPQIPLIVRSCVYLERGTLCATVSSFVKKPLPMPSCPNQHHLSAHLFGW